MKLSFSFGKGRRGGNKLDIKQFLLQHAEKIFMGLACLLMVILLALGYKSGSQFDSSRTPADLVRQVRAVESELKAPRWDEVYKPQRDRTDRRALTDRATEALVPVSVDAYPTPMPWEPLIFPPQTKRADPNLLPVDQLGAVAGHGALAVRPAETGPAGPLGAEGGGTFGSGNPTRHLPPQDEAELEQTNESIGGGAAQGVYFVCVRGLIPFQKQLDEYKNLFFNAAGYDPVRDYPKYFTFKVQRAEVQPGGGPPQWVDLDWPFNSKDRAVRESVWSGRPPELADERYILRSPAFSDTTFLLPPLLRQDMRKWAVIPGIPRARTLDQFGEDATSGEAEGNMSEPDPFGRPGGAFSEEGTGDEGGAADWRGGGAANRGDSEEGGATYGGDRDPPTEFKLFRFFDFHVEPGKSYQYRVQLWLEDPNYPKDDARRLSLRMLSTEAANRIRPLMTSADTKKFYRTTPWSEPTEVVTVTFGNDVLAGPVTAPGQMATRSRKVRFPKPYDEPRAKVLVLEWNNQLAADIPAETEVRRGSLANFTQETEYLRPTEPVLEKLTHQFKLNTVIVDIAGGQALPSAIRGENLTSSGEILLLDEQGNLKFHDELDDLQQYKRNTFLPPEAAGEEGSPEGNYDEGGDQFRDSTPADEKI